MNVGIVGSGTVGVTLANGFVKHGYAVMIGTGDKSKHDTLRAKTAGRAQVGCFSDAAKFGETVVLATKGAAAESVVKSIGPSVLRGKTVIDVTNPIADGPPANGVLKFFTSLDESLMERLQKLAPGADFVKAFSCVGYALMVNPDLGGAKPTMFVCGNRDGAKKQVGRILDQFGFEMEDLGSVEAARGIEPLCIVWCIPGFLRNDWMHAFKMLRK